MPTPLYTHNLTPILTRHQRGEFETKNAAENPEAGAADGEGAGPTPAPPLSPQRPHDAQTLAMLMGFICHLLSPFRPVPIACV